MFLQQKFQTKLTWIIITIKRATSYGNGRVGKRVSNEERAGKNRRRTGCNEEGKVHEGGLRNTKKKVMKKRGEMHARERERWRTIYLVRARDSRRINERTMEEGQWTEKETENGAKREKQCEIEN